MRCVTFDTNIEEMKKSVTKRPQPLYGINRSKNEQLVQVRSLVPLDDDYMVGYFSQRAPRKMRRGMLYIIMHHTEEGECDTIFCDEHGEKTAAHLIVYSTSTDLFSRIKGVINETTLKKKRVVIFGLGSVGSIFSTMIVKCGVEKIKGIDKDILEAHNIVRHELDSRDLGREKSHAMGERLRAVNPLVEYEGISADVTKMGPSELEALIADCDLAVDGTGVPAVSAAVALACKNKAVPFLCVGIYPREDGGGEMIFQLPQRQGHEKTPCYFCVASFRSNIAFSEALPLLDYSIVRDAEHAQELMAVPGLGVDITYIVSIAVLHAIGIIDPADERSILVEGGSNYRLIGTAVPRGDFFTAPFKMIKVRPRELCPDCLARNGNSLSVDEKAALLDSLDIVEEREDESQWLPLTNTANP